MNTHFIIRRHCFRLRSSLAWSVFNHASSLTTSPPALMPVALVLDNKIKSSRFACIATQARHSFSSVPEPEFLPFKIEGIMDYSHDTKIFRLSVRPSDLTTLQLCSSGIGPVFHFTLRVTLEDGSVETRPFTPVSYDVGAGELEFLIKHYGDGTITPVLHDQLSTGAVIELQGPFPGNFVYADHQKGSLALFAAGTGITPILQIAREKAMDSDSSGDCHVYCSNKSEGDILCKLELDSLEMIYGDKFKVFHTVEASPSNGFFQGHISSKILAATKLPVPGLNDHAVVCGPPGFNNSVKDMLVEHGYGADQITTC